MATEPLDIKISQKGGKVVVRTLDDVAKSGDKATKSSNLLRNALGGIAIATTLRQLQLLTDTYTNIQNRLKNVTNNTQELNVVTKQLFAISNATRGSFESTAEVYSRVALSVKEMGISQKQTLEFTKSLNQAVALSGASAQEAQAGMIQLSQGLASGALRGDELRSVLEQLPAVADVIAKGLGVTRGELRELGAEGKISALTVLNAFKDAREELELKFAKTVPTIGQSFVVFRNNLIQVIGAMDQATGASSSFARMILFLAGHMDTLARSVLALSIALSVHLAGKAIPAVINGMRALTLAIATNPIGAIAVAITLAISTLIAFADKIKLTSNSLVTLGDIGNAVWEKIRAGLTGITAFFRENFSGVYEIVVSTFSDINISLESFLKYTAKAMDFYINIWRTAYKVVLSIFRNLGPALKGIMAQAMNGVISAVEGSIKSLVEAYNSVARKLHLDEILFIPFKKIENENREGAYNLGQAIIDGVKEGMSGTTISDVLDDTLIRATEISTQRLKEQAAAQSEADAAQAGLNIAKPALNQNGKVSEMDNLNKSYLQQIELLQMTGRERAIQEGLLQAEKTLKRELTAVERDLVTERLKEIQVLKDQNILAAAGKNLSMEIELMRMGNTERKIKTELMGIEAELGRRLTETEAAALGQKLQTIEALRMENELLSEINGTQDLMFQKSEALNSLYDSGKISLEQYTAALAKLKTQAGKTGTTIAQDFGGAMKKAENAIIQFAKTGEFSLGSFLQGIGEELMRIGLQKAIIQPLSNAIDMMTTSTQRQTVAIQQNTMAQQQNNAAKSQQGGSSGMSGGAGWGGIVMGVVGIASQLWAAEERKKNDPNYEPQGFARGGQFKVGGSGGTDSQRVSFRASPEEVITVETPAQRRERLAENSGGSSSMEKQPDPTPVNVYNITDPSIIEELLATNQGQEGFLNHMRRNQTQIREMLGI